MTRLHHLFFDFPALRDWILPYIISDRFIHLEFGNLLTNGVGFRHTIGAATQSESKVYQEIKLGNQIVPNMDSEEYFTIPFSASSCPL